MSLGRHDEKTLLTAGTASLGVRLTSAQADQLLDYLDLVYLWNRTAGLTRIDRARAVRLHLLDALSVVPALGGARTVADLGSGCGIPGIPLAVAMPELDVVLVESRRKKCSFLAEAVRQLRLQRCSVLEEDARVLAASGHTYQAVTARAFLSPTDLVPLAADLMAAHGRIIVMAAKPQEGLPLRAAMKLRICFERSFTLPGGNEARTVIALERDAR